MQNFIQLSVAGINSKEILKWPLPEDSIPSREAGLRNLPADYSLVVELEEANLEVEVRYRSAGHLPIFEKQVIVTHRGGAPVTILKLNAATFPADPGMIWTGGGKGQPAFCGDRLLAGVRHPFGIVEVAEEGGYSIVRLSQHPGIRLEEGGQWSSFPMICGIAEKDEIRVLLDDYVHSIAKFKPRRIKVYGDWALHDELAEKGRCVELTEEMTRDNIRYIRHLRDHHGISFDYYLIDHGWYSRNSFQQLKKPNFTTDGLRWVAEELDSMGMKLGLWFPVNTFMVNDDGIYCGLEPEGGSKDWYAFHCLKSTYGDHLRKSLFHAIEEWGVRLLKLDFANLSCNNAEGLHFGAKDSFDHELMNRIIEEQEAYELIGIFQEIHAAHPDVLIAAYNGFVSSPWWLEFLDTLYIGDVQPCDVPALSIRTSMNVFTAQRLYQYESESNIPRNFLDDCGTFIGETTTNFYLGKKDWRSQALLSLGRGTQLVYYYGDLKLLDSDDLLFLKSIFHEDEKRYSLESHSFTIGTGSGEEPFMYVHENYAAVYNPTLAPIKQTWLLPQGSPLAGQELITELAPYEAQWIELGQEKKVIFTSGHPLADETGIEIGMEGISLSNTGHYKASIHAPVQNGRAITGRWIFYASFRSKEGMLRTQRPDKHCLIESNYPWACYPDHFCWNNVGWLAVTIDVNQENVRSYGNPWVVLTLNGDLKDGQVEGKSWWIPSH